MWVVIGGISLVFAIYLFLIFPAKLKKEDYENFNGFSYAHRGYHDNKRGPSENTLEAFVLASQGKYGIELDVQLTKDKQVVIYHDSSLSRTSGVDKKILDVNYSELVEVKVFDREIIPLLDEVLDCVDINIPIIVEIKSEGSREWINEICRLTYEVLQKHNNRYCIESVDPLAVRWFKKNAPNIIRGQLSMSKNKYYGSTKKLTAFMLQNLLLNFLSRPHFIAYDHEDKSLSLTLTKLFGCMIVRWTIKDEIRHSELQTKSNGLIFEGYSPLYRW